MRSATATTTRCEFESKRRASVVTRSACALALIGLAIGVPVVLRAEAPVPPLAQLLHLITEPTAWARILKTRLTDGAVVKILVTTAWAVWVWLAACVIMEFAAAARGTQLPRLPASGHVQALVACLVGTSVALFPTSRTVPLLRFDPAAVALTSHQEPGFASVRLTNIEQFVGRDVPEEELDSPGPLGLGTATASETVPRGESDHVDTLVGLGRSYVVQPGDTLWGIAARELGNPLEWRAIAQLNQGRPQADGRALTDDHWIYPGWILELPAVESSPGGPSSASVSLSVTDPPVAPAAPLSDQSVPPEGRAVQVVNNPPYVKDTVKSDGTGDARTPAPLSLVGYGLLGAGVITVLGRMRRAQQRHRSTGLRIALPDGDLAALEGKVRTKADIATMNWVDVAVRAFFVSARRTGCPYPRIVGVRVTEAAIELMGDEGADGQPCSINPFESSRPGSWVLYKDERLFESLRRDPDLVGIDAPLPALVTLGQDEGALVLIDLEEVGSFSVSGPDAEGLLQSIAVELATLSWSDQVEIILVGFDPALEGFERMARVESAVALWPKLERRVRERRRLIALAHQSSNVESRWERGGDAWDLCVVICHGSIVGTEPEQVARLIDLVGDGSEGMALVVGAEAGGARWSLETGGPIVLDSRVHASCLWPQRVDPRFADGIGALLDKATDMTGVNQDEAPYSHLSIPVPPPPPLTSGDEQAPMTTVDGRPSGEVPGTAHHVEVRVLGQVEILGAARPFTRAWAEELVVYLAFHRRGASNEKWATALWPDRLMAPASLHSTASAARRSLGTSINGEDHLPRSHGRLTLGDGVRSDWDRFSELATASEPESWRAALELIRGRPFEGLRSQDWTLLEGIVATIEAVVVDLATRFAELCIANGRYSEAEWSARKGLQVSAYDERLYRILLRCANLAGNPAGVEAVMNELVHLVAEDIEPFDAVHPETLDLYRQLSRRSTSALGG